MLTHELYQLRHVSVVVRAPDDDVDRVAGSELALEVLDGPEAAEGSLDHDGEARAQRLTLLHAEDKPLIPCAHKYDHISCTNKNNKIGR